MKLVQRLPCLVWGSHRQLVLVNLVCNNKFGRTSWSFRITHKISLFKQLWQGVNYSSSIGRIKNERSKGKLVAVAEIGDLKLLVKHTRSHSDIAPPNSGRRILLLLKVRKVQKVHCIRGAVMWLRQGGWSKGNLVSSSIVPLLLLFLALGAAGHCKLCILF